MSWKNRNYPIVVNNSSQTNNKMISHSISPHNENFRPIAQYTSSNEQRFGFQSKHWDKYQCETEIMILQSKGYTIGRNILTTYNNPGKIKKFRDIPETGLDFTGKYPNLIIIERNTMPGMDNLYFNEEELTLLPEASNDC